MNTLVPSLQCFVGSGFTGGEYVLLPASRAGLPLSFGCALRSALGHERLDMSSTLRLRPEGRSSKCLGPNGVFDLELRPKGSGPKTQEKLCLASMGTPLLQQILVRDKGVLNKARKFPIEKA